MEMAKMPRHIWTQCWKMPTWPMSWSVCPTGCRPLLVKEARLCQEEKGSVFEWDGRWGVRRCASRSSMNLHADSTETAGRSLDRKSTRLNSSHVAISYAVFCLNKKI